MRGDRRPVELETGAEEYAIRPPDEDAGVPKEPFDKTGGMEREALIFSGLSFG